MPNMAGVRVVSRADLKRKIDDAHAHFKKTLVEQDAAIQECDEQVLECPSGKEPLSRLTAACQRVADASSHGFKLLEETAKTLGDRLEELETDKQLKDFAAGYRDYIRRFEDRAFLLMKKSSQYANAVSVAMAATGQPPVGKNTRDALELFASMRSAEEDGDDESEWLVEENKLLRDAYHSAVVSLGVTLDEYAQLREFKDLTNGCFHTAGRGSKGAEQALAELNARLPADYVQYKQPLVKVLRLLTRP
ncbi:hypothetical protein HYH02_014318 [Chlamydomonas schloesseri]|uniref:Uncharacterized protein n=1 Tax=Chlamydomonas schloesseri TaxID=2026947 RepID=A0A835SK21_9CHLO|nr:hypothetical protein HYH02_014318 [Chlamydomonas schloesseri]|eukprot:KAG2428617.1 hypothetical protein HYH02_014318 [Chlamydomonas schloesseri]